MGSQILGLVCCDLHNELLLRLVGMILLLPATLLVLVSNVLFGGKFAEHVTCNTFSETISVIIFFAVNMAFWDAYDALLSEAACEMTDCGWSL